MKKWLKKHFASKNSVENNRELKPLKKFFKADYFWKFNSQTVARGVAAGLAGSVIPGFQIFYAALLAIILRGNLPIALVATLLTNPLTVLPIVYFICFVGSFIVGKTEKDCNIQDFHWDFSSFHAFWSNFTTWILQFSKAYIVGVPIVSLGLGILGYFGTIFIWKAWKFLSR